MERDLMGIIDYIQREAAKDTGFVKKQFFKLADQALNDLKKDFLIFKNAHEGKITLTDHEKGELLERMVRILLLDTKIYKIYKNIRNNTNEIDVLLRLTDYGAFVKIVLPEELQGDILCECKNHDDNIGVTWIGKFFSLLKSVNNNIGILFSYYPFTGRNQWHAALGLCKKIYLRDRVVIINFNVKDFEAIIDGDNFANIVIKKIDEIKFHTDIDSYISLHPAQE